MEGKRQKQKGKRGNRQVNTIENPHTHRYQ